MYMKYSFLYLDLNSIHIYDFRLNRLSQIVGFLPIPGFTGFKAFGLGMVELSNFLMSKYKKVNNDSASI